MKNTINRFFSLLLILVFIFTLTGCGSSTDQPSDISGVYSNETTTYVFAKDGKVSITEGDSTQYGMYTSENGNLTIDLGNSTLKYTYVLNSSDIEIYKSLLGTSYTKTGDAPDTVEGWVDPGITTASETTAETKASETTSEETTSAEAVTTQTETTAAETTTKETTTEETMTQAETTTTATTPAPTETTTESPTYHSENNPNLTGDIYPGSTVYYGTYEQDNNTSDGAEWIEWIVLKVDGNRCMLLSKYGLDCQPYDNTGSVVTWETCSLRQWLNGTFYNSAFNDSEKSMIYDTWVTADANYTYSNVNPGNSVTDKVFLLSTEQAYMYFPAFEDRVATPTAYAKAQGASYDDSEGGYWWWLRTPGKNELRAALIHPYGAVDFDGTVFDDSMIMVRPVIWVTFR